MFFSSESSQENSFVNKVNLIKNIRPGMMGFEATCSYLLYIDPELGLLDQRKVHFSFKEFTLLFSAITVLFYVCISSVEELPCLDNFAIISYLFFWIMQGWGNISWWFWFAGDFYQSLKETDFKILFHLFACNLHFFFWKISRFFFHFITELLPFFSKKFLELLTYFGEWLLSRIGRLQIFYKMCVLDPVKQPRC